MKYLLDSVMDEQSSYVKDIFIAHFGNSVAQHMTHLLPDGTFVATGYNEHIDLIDRSVLLPR